MEGIAPEAPAEGQLAEGTVLSDRYRILALLGEGGMGAVYRAEHVHMKKVVALKVLLSDLAKQPEVVARFEREAVAAGNIEHPNVVAATDFGRMPDGGFFLVMELVEGRSLRDELASGPIEPRRAVAIMRGILGAVEAAHAKTIVHRDLKPENVMLVSKDGEPDFAKVLDFGIAKVDVSVAASGTSSGAGGAVLTRMGMIMGTPEYMAPEQALGQEVDARVDLYALGVILYEMLTGRPPFHGEPLQVMRAQVMTEPPPLPEALLAALPGAAAFMARALAKEPAHRFADARELRAGLDALTDASSPVLESVGDRATVGAAPIAIARSGEGAPADPIAPTSAYAPVTVEPAAGRALARWHLVAAAALVFTVLGASAVALALGRPDKKTEPRAAATLATDPSASATVASIASAEIADPPPGPSASASATAVLDLDDEEPSAAPGKPGATKPKPKPRATKKPAAAKKPARKTGPGGIYVPPPSQWFK